MVESRSGGAFRDAQDAGDVGEWQPDVVMKDDDHSVVGAQALEASLQLIAIGDRYGWIGNGVAVNGQESNEDTQPLHVATLAVARTNNQPIRPRLPPIRVAKHRQIAPRLQERLLRGIPRGVWIAKDSKGNAVQPID
jgi:hypothetical protein